MSSAAVPSVRVGPQPQRPPASWPGLLAAPPILMGVVNVTPDSFSDGGDFLRQDLAVEHGLALAAAGAAVIDVGGESTRPYAEPVPVDMELARVLPVIRRLAADGLTVSIDTRHAAVMAAALDAGAAIVNDITALAGDPDSLGVVAAAGCPVVLMHMSGTPRTMQVAPRYDDVGAEGADHLAGRIAACEAAGIDRARIAIDPGIGFGKTVAHNLELLRGLGRFAALGVPVLVGTSRKSFIGALAGGVGPKDRLAGSLVTAVHAARCGAQILRVHDVAETAQALAVAGALEGVSSER